MNKKFNALYSSGKELNPTKMAALSFWAKADPGFENNIGVLTNRIMGETMSTGGGVSGMLAGAMINPRGLDLIELAQERYLDKVDPAWRQGIRNAHALSRR